VVEVLLHRPGPGVPHDPAAYPALQPLTEAIGLPLSMMPAMVFFMSADQAGGIDRVHLRFEKECLRFSWSEGPERNTVLCGMDGRGRKCKITLGRVEFGGMHAHRVYEILAFT